jgi:nucleotide-binding universal stress UspA family protein
MYKKILVATDGTKLSKKAVEAASKLAADFDAVLTVVRIVPHYAKTLRWVVSLEHKEMADIEKWTVRHRRRSINCESTIDKHISVNAVVQNLQCV